MEDDQNKPLIPFDPVPLRARHDGWTVDKQIAFIEALAETGIVEEACRRVGMSRTSADKLRWRASGAPFRRAWQNAIDYALYRIEENALRRAREGVPRPIFHKGEQVGEYRHYDERLTMFLLRSYRPDRYGKTIEQLLSMSPDEAAQRDPGILLDSGLTQIEFEAHDVEADEADEADDEEGCAR